ncbi:EamA family transporter [Yersinia ruckeri]|uniref:EamA family transporter n=1 Tax=Yersinia ruckeri TaxID=29486 RepID=UPI000BDE91DF|nr:EamA family transporter [Yersinia ruckeri]ELM3739283.1 EamA family transporter [Yersinia ruckeri]MCK8540387.1 EamA family transporter [Yersinia ruckeri]MCK8573110.1 EamA family transporter [Yersinia ruckeri]MCK8576420.1 EamA family transporter [Yersinia ruckeri]MCK8579835.1 EamA family transporter [Yersinia ruckeri]
MSRRIDFFVGFLVTVLWGGNFAIIELGLRDLDPFVLTFLRFAFCAFPLVFFIKRPEGVSILYVAIYGIIFGVGLWWVVNFAMYNGLSAGLSSVFLQFSAFFTIILSAFFFKEKITKVHWVGIFLSFLGLICIIVFSNQESTIKGILLVVVAALSWAFCNMIVKMKKPPNMVSFIVWSSLFSAPAVLCMTVLTKGWGGIVSIPHDITFGSSFSVLFQAYITTIVGYLVWNNLIKKYPAAEVAPLSLFVPISGMITSYIFLDERLSVAQFLSVVIVVIGIAVFLNASRIISSIDGEEKAVIGKQQ